MNLPWSRLEGPARLLVTCIVTLLVAGGLCGLQLFILNLNPNSDNPALTDLFMVTGAAELGAILVSIVLGLGALVRLIWLRITHN